MIVGYQIISGAVSQIETLSRDAIYICVDEQVDRLHHQYLAPLYALAHPDGILRLPGGEASKKLRTLEQLWSWLADRSASRSSILVLIGGGALTDLGGLAAATYMRGIRTVVLPTTLLGMVDAGIGGKTAIDFAGTKNLIGAFHQPELVVLDVSLLDSLPIEELYSGYGEVIKTALLCGADLWHQVLSLGDPQGLTSEDWVSLVRTCAEYKAAVVAQDPLERTGLRAALNLGHTIAHALEAYSHTRGSGHTPLSHGHAVVIGLIVELYLSTQLAHLPVELLRQTLYLARELYPYYPYTCHDYPELLRLMRLDKKASAGVIRITGLSQLGQVALLEVKEDALLKEALDFYREAFGG